MASVTTLRPDLAARTKDIFEEAVRKTGGSEPQYVWSIFNRGIGRIREALAPTYGSRLTVNGVFCHGSPVVDFQHGQAPRKPKGCELGDLLLVVNHVFPGGAQQGRALLLQCKMAHHPDVPKRQELLYRYWPPFSYRRNSTQRRDVKPAPHAGAQFAFIDTEGPIILAQGARMPPRAHPWEDSLACAVVAMIGPPPGGGRLFLPHRERQLDTLGWSQVVWDLLQTAFSGASYRGAARVFDPKEVAVLLDTSMDIPRILTTSGFAPAARDLWTLARGGAVQSAGYDGPPFRDAPPRDSDPEDAGGISTILLEFDWATDPNRNTDR